MLRKLFITASAILCLTFCGCTSDTAVSDRADAAVESVDFTVTGETDKVTGYEIWITRPEGWIKSDTDNLDYQCFKKDNNVYLSMFTFNTNDLPENIDMQVLFEFQNNDLLEKRDNIVLLEDTVLDSGTMYKLYSGEKDGTKFYHACWMLGFKDTEQMVWVSASGVPEEIQDTLPEITGIIYNITDKAPINE